jgi:hypothetical protein
MLVTNCVSLHNPSNSIATVDRLKRTTSARELHLWKSLRMSMPPKVVSLFSLSQASDDDFTCVRVRFPFNVAGVLGCGMSCDWLESHASLGSCFRRFTSADELPSIKQIRLFNSRAAQVWENYSIDHFLLPLIFFVLVRFILSSSPLMAKCMDLVRTIKAFTALAAPIA